ncbi:hypothetical protein D9M68_395800 [compost metagenome]
MHRLQAIARIGKGTTDDHAHRVIEIGLSEFVFDVDREDFFGQFAHEKPGSFYWWNSALPVLGQAE